MMADAVEQLRARVAIREPVDVAIARRHVRALAAQEGLPGAAAEALVIATSELAQNIVVHADRGEIVLGVTRDGPRRVVVVVARDRGPGIPDLDQALRDGYSTAGSLGLGLPSARRLVDEFSAVSVVGQGTTVVMKKWIP